MNGTKSNLTTVTYCEVPWSWGTYATTPEEARKRYEEQARQYQLYRKTLYTKPGRVIPVDGAPPTQENTTMIAQVTFTKKPTVKEQETGAVEEIIATVTVAGANSVECVAKASVECADKLKGVAGIATYVIMPSEITKTAI